MWEISQSLLLKATEAAKKMLPAENVSPVPFGKENATIFVSRDPDLVKGTDEFVLDGEKFFIGTKK